MTQNSNMPIIARFIYIQEIHIGFKNAGLLISTVCNHFSDTTFGKTFCISQNYPIL